MLTEEVMDLVRADVLKSLARKAGLPKTLTRKGEVIAALADYLHSTLSKHLGYVLPQ